MLLTSQTAVRCLLAFFKLLFEVIYILNHSSSLNKYFHAYYDLSSTFNTVYHSSLLLHLKEDTGVRQVPKMLICLSSKIKSKEPFGRSGKTKQLKVSQIRRQICCLSFALNRQVYSQLPKCLIETTTCMKNVLYSNKVETILAKN